MAYTSGSLFLLLALLLSIVLPHHPSLFAAAADSAMVAGLCKNTKTPAVCQACLKNGPSDVPALAKLATGCARTTLQRYHDLTYKTAGDTPPGKLKDVLDGCADNSYLAVDELDHLVQLIESRDYRSARDFIPTQVNHLVDVCFAQFYNHPELTMPKQIYDAAADADRDLNTVTAILSTLL